MFFFVFSSLFLHHPLVLQAAWGRGCSLLPPAVAITCGSLGLGRWQRLLLLVLWGFLPPNSWCALLWEREEAEHSPSLQGAKRGAKLIFFIFFSYEIHIRTGKQRDGFAKQCLSRARWDGARLIDCSGCFICKPLAFENSLKEAGLLCDRGICFA